MGKDPLANGNEDILTKADIEQASQKGISEGIARERQRTIVMLHALDRYDSSLKWRDVIRMVEGAEHWRM